MNTKFKRNLSVTVIALVALIAALLLGACSQEDSQEVIPMEKLKIFIASSPSNSGLKSAAMTTEKTEVAVGDTVVQTRCNILMWVTTDIGLPVNGSWVIELVKTDYSNVPGVGPIFPSVGRVGDQIAYNFPEIGLYKVSFGKFTNGITIEERIYFFVRIWDYPGKVGDEADSNYIFRLENKVVYDLETQRPKNLVFVYFKFESAQNMNPEQAYVSLIDHKKDGSAPMEMIHLTKWPFSRDYYYFIINPDESSLRRYRVLFIVSETQGFSGFADNNNYRSSWSNGTNGIEFAVQ